MACSDVISFKGLGMFMHDFLIVLCHFHMSHSVKRQNYWEGSILTKFALGLFSDTFRLYSIE